MDRTKRKKLEAAGWRVGSADEFLGLTSIESTLVDIRLALSAKLRELRDAAGLSQSELADRIRSSQSRVAKMEAAAQDVSLELLLRGIMATGGTRKELGRVVGGVAVAAGSGQARGAVSRRESTQRSTGATHRRAAAARRSTG